MLAFTLSYDFVNRHVKFFSKISYDAKDDKASKDRGTDVSHTDNEGIFVAVIVELVVAGQSNQASPGR